MQLWHYCPHDSSHGARATALLLFAGASTAACGSTKSNSKGKASASPSAKVPTAEELKKGLLALSDMPTGYAASPEESAGTGGSPQPEDTSSVTSTSAECNRQQGRQEADPGRIPDRRACQQRRVHHHQLRPANRRRRRDRADHPQGRRQGHADRALTACTLPPGLP